MIFYTIERVGVSSREDVRTEEGIPRACSPSQGFDRSHDWRQEHQGCVARTKDSSLSFTPRLRALVWRRRAVQAPRQLPAAGELSDVESGLFLDSNIWCFAVPCGNS